MASNPAPADSDLWKAHHELLMAAQKEADDGLAGFAKSQAISVSLAVAEQIPVIGLLATGVQVGKEIADELNRQSQVLPVMLRVTGHLRSVAAAPRP